MIHHGGSLPLNDSLGFSYTYSFHENGCMASMTREKTPSGFFGYGMLPDRYSMNRYTKTKRYVYANGTGMVYFPMMLRKNSEPVAIFAKLHKPGYIWLVIR